MEPIVSSETSVIRTQMPGNYPKRNNLHLEHGESLRTRFMLLMLYSVNHKWEFKILLGFFKTTSMLLNCTLFCNASRHILLPFCHTITKDQSTDIKFGHMQLLHVTFYTITNLCDHLPHLMLGILKSFISVIWILPIWKGANKGNLKKNKQSKQVHKLKF